MKCPKTQVKDRYSNSGKGHPGPHRTSIRGHTWRIIEQNDKLLRRCSLCGKTVRKLQLPEKKEEN